ncbi:hypothetical protein ACFVYG_44210 [Streptomyces sp. NPDC058256]|uniref:hypothetical protein n=1 Tax=Streptomyces sp. NPDC058256 TaxID=3346408 RepID=UPI0036E33EFA
MSSLEDTPGRVLGVQHREDRLPPGFGQPASVEAGPDRSTRPAGGIGPELTALRDALTELPPDQ